MPKNVSRPCLIHQNRWSLRRKLKLSICLTENGTVTFPALQDIHYREGFKPVWCYLLGCRTNCWSHRGTFSSTDSASENQLVFRIDPALCSHNLNFASIREEPNSSTALFNVTYRPYELGFIGDNGPNWEASVNFSSYFVHLLSVPGVIWFLEAGFPCTHTIRLASISFIQFTINPLINVLRAKSEERWSVQTAAGLHQPKTKCLDNTEKVEA